MKALFVHHGVYTSLGFLADRAEERGFDVQTVDFPTADLDPRRFSLVVILGTDEAAYDDSLPWLAGEMAFVRSALEEEVPTLGVCFGAQLLARCLGGEVQPAAATEVGWTSIHTRLPEVIDAGPWFEIHSDGIALPPGVVPLARNDAGVQAFETGKVLGMQFHPEVTAELIEEWLAAAPELVADAAVDAGAVIAETAKVIESAQSRAYMLFDRVWERLTS